MIRNEKGLLIAINESMKGLETMNYEQEKAGTAIGRNRIGDKTKLPLIKNIFTLTSFLGIIVCIICNIAIQGIFTWSLYPIVAIVYAWAISIPLFQSSRGGLLISLCLISALTVPFLYVLGILSGCKEAMLFIGTRSTLAGIIYLWIAYILFAKTKKRFVTAGILALVAIPVAWVFNYTVDYFTGYSRIDVWDYIVYAILALTAMVFFIIGSRKKNDA